MEQIWDILNEPLVIVALAGLLLYALNRLYAKVPIAKKFEGAVIQAIREAERRIPDDTTNSSKAKLDTALQYVLKVIEKYEGRKPTRDESRQVLNAIEAKHTEMEAGGNLKR